MGRWDDNGDFPQFSPYTHAYDFTEKGLYPPYPPYRKEF